MSYCFYCGRYDSAHESNCPELEDSELAKAIWQQGYDEGKSVDILYPTSTDPTFVLGFFRGVHALGDSET